MHTYMYTGRRRVRQRVQACMDTHKHTHTHTHAYIYIHRTEKGPPESASVPGHSLWNLNTVE